MENSYNYIDLRRQERQGAGLLFFRPINLCSTISNELEQRKELILYMGRMQACRLVPRLCQSNIDRVREPV